MVRKAKKFNWQGISENYDGTFTATGKREKRRVLKALHEQGVAVRSRKNADGSFTVTPVGSVRVKAQPRTASVSAAVPSTGRRINTREKGFPMYPKPRAGAPRGGAGYPQMGGPVYRGGGAGPRASGPSALDTIGKKAGEYMRGRAQKKIEAQKTREETKKLSEEMEQKWGKDEIASHQEAIVKEEHRRHEEKMRAESDRTLDERIKTMNENQRKLEAEQRKEEQLRRQQFKQEARKPGEGEQYRINEIQKRHQEQRQQRQEARNRATTHGGFTPGSTRAPEIPHQKVDPATLQHAREQVVTGND